MEPKAPGIWKGREQAYAQDADHGGYGNGACRVRGGAVWAQDQIIHCLTAPCYGSGNLDLIYEQVGNGVYDEIIMKGDHDRVRAQRYTNDRDVVKGGPGHDTLNVADGDTRDSASGGRGDDTCFVDARSEAPGCEGVRVR